MPPAPLTDRSNLLNELRPIIRKTLAKVSVPAHAHDDAEQRTLTALAPHVGKLRQMEPRMRLVYVYRAAMRVGIRMRRRLAGELLEEADIEAVMDPGAALDEALVREQQGKRLIIALNQLDRHERDVIDRMFEGKSEREAARELGVSRRAVAHRLRDARSALLRAWAGTTSWLAKGRHRDP